MTPQYTFRLLRAIRDPEGYYQTRWDKAVPFDVTASTEAEAYEKLWALSGKAPNHRRWTARLLSATEVPTPPVTNGDER